MVRARRWQRPSSTYLSTSGGLLSGKISHLVFPPLSSMNFSIFRVRVLDFLETGQRKRKKTRKGDERKEGSLHTEGGDGIDLRSVELLRRKKEQFIENRQESQETELSPLSGSKKPMDNNVSVAREIAEHMKLM
nr:uncharacterized protein LOC109745230 isoform X2 [Aegilops tauschii subsp. strangulata]